MDLQHASEGTITSDPTDLFLELGAAAKRKRRGVCFLLDEMQFVDEIQYRAMISALHRVTQKGLPITVAAAGLPQIPRLSGEARLGSGPYRSGDVAKKMGRNVTALSPVRQQLLNKGLVYATEDFGHIDFTVPRFDDYMRRHMPYRAPRKRAANPASQ